MSNKQVQKRKDANGRLLRTGEGQRKDGLYYYHYVNQLGQRQFIYAKTLLALREKEDKIQKERLDGMKIYCSGKATLNYVFDRYIQTKQHLKKNTINNYIYMYDRFVRPVFGKKEITEIIYSDVIFFYMHLLNEKGLKINTLEGIHTTIHPVFQMAVRDNVIRSNPSDGAYGEIKKRFGTKEKKRHPLTIDQQNAFLEYTRSSAIYGHWYPLMAFLFGTGCRIGEASGLRWEDVDLDNRTISINHTLVYLCERGQAARFYISTPKTESGKRTIPMMDSVKAALEEEYLMRERFGFNQDEIDGMSNFIFTGRDGHVYNPASINRAIKRIYTAYNEDELTKAATENRMPILIPHFTCHHIRHTFCTRFCEVETNIKAIQEIMGHSSFETTMDIYAEATERVKKEAMNTLQNSNKLFH